MKVVSLDQSATLRTSDAETPLSLAAEAAADLVECPLQIETSIPTALRTYLSQRDTVEDAIGL